MKDSDRISQATCRSIAEQCGATDFDAWCDWIDLMVALETDDDEVPDRIQPD